MMQLLISLIVAASVLSPADADRAGDTCRGVPVTIPAGTPGDDVIFGTPGPDVINGRSGDDVIRGLGGDDVLCGGTGNDLIIGGAGDDQLLGGAGADTLRAGDGSDFLDGGDADDMLLGQRGDDLLRGRAGDDLLRGGPGADEADFGLSPASVTVSLKAHSSSGDGTDRIDGIEHITGSPFDDMLIGSKAANRIDGMRGDDVIRGKQGDDTLDGGPGLDLADFAFARRRVIVDLSQRTARGEGTDRLDSFEGAIGSRYDDVLIGGGGDDVLRGIGGDDAIDGRRGDDTLIGGPGRDTLDGGPGADTCQTGETTTSCLLGLTLTRMTRLPELHNAGVVTSPPDDDRAFVVDQEGLVWIIYNGSRLPTSFLDISALVSRDAGERGLLGLTFHPGYAVNGRFFVYYSNLDGDTVLAEYAASQDPDVADPSSARILLTIDQPAQNHNGGMLAFGPQGLLHIAVGDGGGAGDPFENGGDPTTLNGAILRIDVDTATGYTIPESNPFASGAGGAPEVFHYGLRNPWRMSFDPVTGDLWIGDVGQDAREEVNVAPAGSTGIDFGWNTLEGTLCFDPPSGCSSAGTTPPYVEYDHSEGVCSVIGGYVYRGTGMPEIYGHYLHGDFCAGWVRTFRPAGSRVADVVDWLTLDPGDRLTSFGSDSSGNLYLSTRAGVVYRIDPVR